MGKKMSLIELTMLIGVAVFANGQTAPTIHQSAKQSSCSNIVALSGAKVDCTNLTPAQKKALEHIPAILKMAVENQDYLDAIMKKLDELSQASPQPVVNYAPGGFATSGGTLIDPQITNIGKITPPNRLIMMPNALNAIAILKQAPPGSKVQFRIVGGSQEIDTFANNVAGMFQAAGWGFVSGTRTGQLNSIDALGRVSHGEGIECGGTDQDPMFERAKEGLAAAGYQCRVITQFAPGGGDKDKPYIYIQIGTRILPED